MFEISAPCSELTNTLHAGFLTILPKIERHGHIYFRHFARAKREEAIAEMVALAWKWYRRLVERGKDARQFPSVLASYAARAVSSGRRLAGHERAKDVMSPRAQQRGGFTVESLPTIRASMEQLYSDVHGQQQKDALEEALHDNMRTPPDEQAAFRIDFPDWRRTHAERDRQIMDDLMIGERTSDVADKYRMSPARVSQLRRSFMEGWEQFCADELAAA